MTMLGKNALIRTLQYLDRGDIYLLPSVQIFTVHYLSPVPGRQMQGARDFTTFKLPQLQHRNPHVQIVTFANITPSPFIRVFMQDKSEILVDMFNRNMDDIWQHVKETLGKSEEQLQKEREAAKEVKNPAYLGEGCPRICACKLPGQLVCSSRKQFPRKMRTKGRDMDWAERDKFSWNSTGFFVQRQRQLQERDD